MFAKISSSSPERLISSIYNFSFLSYGFSSTTGYLLIVSTFYLLLDPLFGLSFSATLKILNWSATLDIILSIYGVFKTLFSINSLLNNLFSGFSDNRRQRRWISVSKFLSYSIVNLELLTRFLASRYLKWKKGESLPEN